MSATAIRLTKSQKELLATIAPVLMIAPTHTAGLAKARGDHSSFQTTLRDRLFRLESLGLLVSENTTKGRFWSLTEVLTPWHFVLPERFAYLPKGFREKLIETPNDLGLWMIALDWLSENCPAGKNQEYWQERINNIRRNAQRHLS